MNSKLIEMNMKNLNYGVIGNCRTAAFVSEGGSIDWLCFPDFDSPSVFAKILDQDKGGSFDIKVSEDYRFSQKYIPQTNILCTHFISSDAEFMIYDFMPCYRAHGDNEDKYYHPAELYRYINVLKGSPSIRVHYHPAPNYAKGRTVYTLTDEYLMTYSSIDKCNKQYLYSSLALKNILDETELVLEKDEFFLLSYNEKVISVDLEREKLEYCRTLVYWQNWTNRTKKYTAYNDLIERSLLVLKLMSYHNGSVLAALTTSLPEKIGDVRNWDYRFCWLRDASMSMRTLFEVGHVGAAKRFMKFVGKTFVSCRQSYQIMYGIRGERQLTEHILDHLCGYKGSRPVRIGNDAYRQKQNDSLGYLMDLIYQYYRLFSGTLDEIEDMWGMVKRISSKVIVDWKKPDKGIWEIRGDAHHFVSSKVMCWVALDRGVRIAQLLHKEQYAKAWQNEADKIKADVLLNGWKDDLQSFTQTYDNDCMDSSLLLMESYGFIDSTDMRYRKTVHSVKRALLHKGLMYRYNNEDDFGMPGSAFTICSFWLVRALYVIGEKDEAKKLFDEILQYSNHVGLFSEDLDFDTKEQLGNFPQAYSHLAVVNTAILFAEDDHCLSFLRP